MELEVREEERFYRAMWMQDMKEAKEPRDKCIHNLGELCPGGSDLGNKSGSDYGAAEIYQKEYVE